MNKAVLKLKSTRPSLHLQSESQSVFHLLEDYSDDIDEDGEKVGNCLGVVYGLG